MKEKYTVEDEVKYMGGSLDGKLVRPSLVNAALYSGNSNNKNINDSMGISNSYQIPDADYPMAMHEDYKPIEIDGKLVFKLAKAYKTEMTIQ